ncbi:hypothetical protein [Pollutibacter soli]|uniref:hypothetical protein n=1 Tax=Pollutibacter soli TaxID=3034157 RepID=UPI00301417B8
MINKMYTKRLTATLLLISVCSCSPSIQYLGKAYPTTQNVEVFLDTHDITRPYTVMGKIDGLAGIFNNSFPEIQNRIVQEAKAKGADAVLIYNMEERVIHTNTNTNTNINITGSTEHRQWLDRNIFTTSTTSTNDVTRNVLHADFLKYRQ